MICLNDLSHDRQIAFYDALADRLPDSIHGANNKKASSNFMDKYIAIHDHKFIRFNTKNWVQILVFDIDNVTGTSAHWYKKFIDSTGMTPSYVSRTDNGIQAGIFLDEKTYIRDYDGNDNTNRVRLATLKKVIGSKIEGIDIAGSNRLLGIWRNPICHKDTTISTNCYTLDTLLKHFDISKSMAAPQRRVISHSNTTKMTLSAHGSIETALNAGFVVGNRNRYLFSFGFKTVFENRSTLTSIESLMQVENSYHSNPITSKEVSDIAKSVEKLAPTMYHPAPKTTTPAKHRQYMYDNNIHGLYNRYSFGAFVTASKKREATSGDILDALLDLFQSGVTEPTNKQVVELTSIGVRQWQKLKAGYSVSKIFMAFVDNLFTTHPIDIKAKFTPLLKRVFEGINKHIVACEKTGEAVVKYIFDGTRWIKPYEYHIQAA